MPTYRLTWTETLTALVEADSESAARQAWLEGEADECARPTDNRYDYDLEVEVEPD